MNIGDLHRRPASRAGPDRRRRRERQDVVHRFSITGTLAGGDHRSCFAPPGSLHPRARIFPVFQETDISTAPWHGFPPAIAMTGLAPGRGPGGVGVLERDVRVPFCPGRGRAPSPVPSPRGDSHHGPVYRDKPGKSGSSSLLPRETAASTIPGGGGGARSAGRAGVAREAYGYSTWVKRGRGGGAKGSAPWGGRDKGQTWSVHLESV